MNSPSYIPYFLILLLQFSSTTFGTLLQGCALDDDLCDASEVCIPDGLFGQCYSDVSAISPLILEKPLSDNQKELLHYELARLSYDNRDWSDARTQCVLAYFKLSIAYELDYDTEFCSVRNAQNIWALVEKVQAMLSKGASAQNTAALVENDIAQSAQRALLVDEESGVAMPVILVEEPAAADDEGNFVLEEPQFVELEDDAKENATSAKTNASSLTEAEMNKDKRTKQQEKNAPAQTMNEKTNSEPLLSDTEVLEGAPVDVEGLTIEELDQIIDSLKNVIEQEETPQVSAPEVEEPIPLTSEDNEQQVLLKKDIEKFDNSDLGLANTVHKIVKGDIQRVEGNRVYLKVAKKKLTEEDLYKLIVYLDKKIAEPNNLYFDEFQYENGQLSFRISRLDLFRKKNEKRVGSAGGVAEAVYKRRKDIQSLSGVEVDETGIGSGADVVPVEKAERDWMFLPILAVCALTITSLISVLTIHLYRNRRRPYQYNLPTDIDHLESGKASTLYEDLCRQRIQEGPVPVNRGTVSKTSSTSSRPDETVLQSCNLDISSGHVILSFLQEYLEHPEKITEQWGTLADYTNKNGETTIASKEENAGKNNDSSVVPYDENIVSLQHSGDVTSASTGYINASKIYDSDLRQVAYVVAQGPTENTVADYWQMVWEQGIALIVNLCDQKDLEENRYRRYWPDEGCIAHGNFEIHLVSEHIWSEDYVVRSFYLKNRSTNETRTVTQFHFLTWPENGCPASNKSLVEFRRKVNKSYRGRASPVLVHCTNGAGRTGTYCLIDVVANRICKGVKELNIAGSLEHLRDQRMAMVSNEEQYKMVFSCVANEVTSLLKTLPQ